MFEFYVGQKVHCKRNGDGVVTARGNAYEDYPIKARFADGYLETYTRDGKILKGTREIHLTSREEVMPKDFYVGQEVCCKYKGKGVVIEINEPTRTYPVKVKFHSGGYETYTADGKAHAWSPKSPLTPVQEEPVFTVGQRVWCVIFGEGVVAEIVPYMYHVKVKFENGEVATYTGGGRMFSKGNRALFHHPVKIVQDESATKPSINWEHVSSEFNYLAEDADGGVFLYEDKPYTATETWMVDNGDLTEAHMLASYTKGACDWKESLIERPEGETS